MRSWELCVNAIIVRVVKNLKTLVPQRTKRRRVFNYLLFLLFFFALFARHLYNLTSQLCSYAVLENVYPVSRTTRVDDTQNEQWSPGHGETKSVEPYSLFSTLRWLEISTITCNVFKNIIPLGQFSFILAFIHSILSVRHNTTCAYHSCTFLKIINIYYESGKHVKH